MRLRARSTAARRRSCSPGSTSPIKRAGLERSASGCSRPSRGSSDCAVLAGQHRDRRALFELIAGERRLLPHFHLSLQAGDDMILKRMKRRHSRADAVRTVELIKASRPDATIGADLIAGFPTETEEMAINSLKLLDDCDIVAAHIFPFSPRPNTPAARMPQLPPELVKARAARLREAAVERRGGWFDSLVGTDPAHAGRKWRQGTRRQFRSCFARRRSPRPMRHRSGSPAATATN